MVRLEIEKDLLIVGAGPAGLAAASGATRLGLSTLIIERSDKPGGHLNDWRWLFPHFAEADEVLAGLMDDLPASVQLLLRTEISSALFDKEHWEVHLSSGELLRVKAVLLCTGFRLFDAHRKEELAYGIFPGIITSADLENRFKSESGLQSMMNLRSAAFIHCVGSRDLKCNNVYCSRICCITAVKQAIELKRLAPAMDISLFYIDMRMSGRYFEELFLKAQTDYNIRFIRGRVSEITQTHDKHLLLKAEDTLLGRPLRVKVDLAVLMAGMEPGEGTLQARQVFGICPAEDGFIPLADHSYRHSTAMQGVFAAGACTGPASLGEVMDAGKAAAVEVFRYVKS